MSKKVNYNEDTIQTLSSLDHIRLRSGMYIGRLGTGASYDDGIYILLKEVIDNSIDEFIEGFGKKIKIKIEENIVSVRDFGRGVPLGKLVACVSKINTGGKFNNEVFQYSVGLNGVGTKAVNALSSTFYAKSHRDGKFRDVKFSKGKILEENEGYTKEPDGTLIEFEADIEIFSQYAYNFDFVTKRLGYYAYLNKGLKLHFNDEIIESKNGLLDLLNDEVDYPIYEPIYYHSNQLEFVFTHVETYGETYYSFVNGQYTNAGGTHQSAFREAVLKAVNEFSKKQFDGKDVRDGLIGSIAIKITDPIFESQTKNKLGNTDVRSWIVNDIKNFIVDYLFKNPDIATAIINKAQLNEKIRKELKNVQKEAREMSKKTALRIPKLKDCKFHLNDSEKVRKRKGWRGDESLIFLTEGDSAAGSMVSCRDVGTQSIFALRGKPKNVFGLKRDEIYKNEELYNVVKSLNIEDSIDGLRYSKIVMATDSDPDGLHIRNLLLTFFLTYFENLVIKGYIYVLETPLFRVRDKKMTFYCYNEVEKNKAIRKLRGKAEITRFKGLGEISPNEFKQFIGPEMRLIQVNVKYLKDIAKTLCFYMGKNTPERKKYIMNNLNRNDEEYF